MVGAKWLNKRQSTIVEPREANTLPHEIVSGMMLATFPNIVASKTNERPRAK